MIKKFLLFLAIFLVPLAGRGQFVQGLVMGGTIKGAVSTPVDSPGQGTYGSTQSVTITATNSASIYYTVDGSTPACPSTGTLYSGAFNVTVTTTVKAIGCNVNFYTPSAVLTSVYTISAAPTVVLLNSADFTTDTSHALPITAGVAVGKGVVLVFLSASQGYTLNSCTDNAPSPNTYTVDQNGTATSNADNIEIGSCSSPAIASAIPATTGTITATFSSSQPMRMAAYVVSPSVANWVDQNPTGYQSTWDDAQTLTAAGPDTGTDDVVFAMGATISRTGALTTGYTALETDVQYATSARYYSTAYKVLASGTPSATYTLSSNGDLVLFLTSYKTQ